MIDNNGLDRIKLSCEHKIYGFDIRKARSVGAYILVRRTRHPWLRQLLLTRFASPTVVIETSDTCSTERSIRSNVNILKTKI
jgi:hypothetical protein